MMTAELFARPDASVDLSVLPIQRGELLTLTREHVVTGEDADAIHALYRRAFRPLTRVAAMKHLMDEASLRAVLADAGITKYVVWGSSPDGRAPLAVATLTTDLSTEAISSSFFTNRYADAARRGELYYLGFLLVAPGADVHEGVLPMLVRGLVTDVSEDGGVIAFDVCSYNDERHFSAVCELLASRVRPSRLTKVDVQTYYVMEFAALSS